MEKIEGLCGICPGGCAVEITMEEGRIKGLKPSKEYSPAAICLRGAKAEGIVYSEDRLKTPLIRTGEKGEGKFREASWEEALNYAADGFLRIKDQYGAQALASHLGRGTFDQGTDDFFANGNPGNKNFGFFAPLGSPNGASVGSMCYVAYGILAPQTTMGLNAKDFQPDIENSDYCVIWGTNPPTASPPFIHQRLNQARRNGVKLIFIDHYAASMSANVDELVLIRSGTDQVLILAMINYIIQNELYDREFVENWTHGFAELKEYTQRFTLEKASQTTGIPLEQIQFLIEVLTTKRASLITYTGLEYSNSGVQSIRSLFSLWALCGHLDQRGGLLLSKPNPKKNPNDSHFGSVKMLAIGEREFPIYHKLVNQPQFLKAPDAILHGKPYKLAGLLNVGAAMTVNYPNTPLFEKAIKSLDFFAVVDRFFTKDCLYADVVFPATTYFEEESYQVFPGKVRVRRKIIEPLGESLPNIYILQRLAEKLGYGHLYPKNPAELYAMRFRDQPEVLEQILSGAEEVHFQQSNEPIRYRKYEEVYLRSDKNPGFPTPTGKFEFDSELLKAYGFDGLPVYVVSKEGWNSTPELAVQFPLIFNSGARIQTTFRTQHLNIEDLVAYQKHPQVIMNTEDAEVRGIRAGDVVDLTSPRGGIQMVAEVIDGIPRGEVEVNVGGGDPGQLGLWAQASVNHLTDEKNIDPISGFPVFKNLLCEVTKAKE
ncbi:MAG: molybdopterin-dependent oxidoreductase [Tissierellia bacterium]|nr:molybdopterin-dependent oxidoreductase [Tissierellia bacterium]